MGVVPVVDVSEAPLAVAAQIDDACRSVGFFQIVNHRIDATIEDRAWAATHDFFALPLDAKLEVAIPPGDAYGYGPYQVERLAASLGVASPPDLKETFSIGPFESVPDGLDDESASFVYSPNRWPAALHGMEATMRGYAEELAILAARLLALMAIGLGVDRRYFRPFIDRHTSALRLLHYPDMGGAALEPGQLRAGAHADYGTITLLRQDDARGGLQVRDLDGAWHAVDAVPGAYVVNVGDALARWTNDRWRSTVHRVAVPPADATGSSERFSIAFFHNANWDAVIECIPTCVAAGDVPRYPPVRAGRHLMDKFRSTQPATGDPG